jgi:cytochrome c oxidase accessory protein FixG
MNLMSETDDAASVRQQREQAPLYVGRVPVYPQRVSGVFRRVKWTALVVMLTIYYVVPWLRWDRGPNAPDQAVLIDLPNSRAYFFWIEIWPQEVYYLMGLLLLAALGLFLVSSLVGRVWCGYACPQTVWTDLFLWVERLLEGDRNARIRRDAGPMTRAKAAIKTTKHAAWLLIAALTGGAWVMYFNDAPTVVVSILTGEATLTVYFFFALLTVMTYVLAGWAREQVCTYMCPWPRFQAAMLDEDSYVVTYRGWRGEPRGRHKKGEPWDGRGDCVDCKQCVAVCPTGVDIREGLQLECIGCGLCVDACNSVMDKVGRPRGLIAYDTERHRRARAEGTALSYRLIRPRTIVYMAVLAVVAVLMAWTLMNRSSLDLTVQHERSPLFVSLSDGGVRNGYTVKILNKSLADRQFSLSLDGIGDAGLRVVGRDAGDAGHVELAARPDSVATYRVYVHLPPKAVRGETMPVTFVLRDVAGDDKAYHATVFRAPPQ